MFSLLKIVGAAVWVGIVAAWLVVAALVRFVGMLALLGLALLFLPLGYLTGARRSSRR